MLRCARVQTCRRRRRNGARGEWPHTQPGRPCIDSQLDGFVPARSLNHQRRPWHMPVQHTRRRQMSAPERATRHRARTQAHTQVLPCRRVVTARWACPGTPFEPSTAPVVCVYATHAASANVGSSVQTELPQTRAATTTRCTRTQHLHHDVHITHTDQSHEGCMGVRCEPAPAAPPQRSAPPPFELKHPR